MNHRMIAAAAVALLASSSMLFAADYATVLAPMKPGAPLAHPIAARDIAPPPFSLIADRPVKPAYVPGLPGLPQARPMKDDFGLNRPPKFDAVVIRKSKVDNGEVVIPPGGLFYLEDTMGGEVALRGEKLPVLSRLPTYIDYDMSIVVKEDVTIPAGQSVVVGGTVYQYYATVGHNKTMNHALHVKTIAGTDWEWAFGSPVLSTTQPGWGLNTKFIQLYNQGQAREVTPQKMVFDWISGVRMDRLLLADEQIFTGLAGAGDEWKAGALTAWPEWSCPSCASAAPMPKSSASAATRRPDEIAENMDVNPWPMNLEPMNPEPMNGTALSRPLACESGPPRDGDQDRDLGGRLNLSDGTPTGAVAIM